LSRGEFLRVAAAGTAGVCCAAIAHGNAAAAEKRNGYVVAVTHGHDDPTRVMLALFTATRLPAGDNHVWFAIDGGQLCKRGEADRVTSPLFTKQGSAAQLLAQIRKAGIALHI
jgi:predicted peroxiredoxin